MFEVRKNERRFSQVEQNLKRAIAIAMEPLESRQMLSASPLGARDGDRNGGGPGGGAGPGGIGPASSIEFSLAPAAVQTGLDALATADSLTAPAATDKVQLDNMNGVETYSVTINSTGTVSRLTVDQYGDAVTAPTQSTTTWAILSGTGTGSDSAASAEITAIATALDLTAPTSTTVVNITTTSAGVVTYSVDLTGTTSTTSSTDGSDHTHDQRIAVDASGNPVGNQQVPFSVLSTAIQNGLNSHAPTGATALGSSSTQSVSVKTTDGIVTYSTTYTVTGTQTTVTVNSTGTLTSLPTTTTTTFSALSSVVQNELQTLATADGVTSTIASTQTVTVLTETNGTIIYSVQLSATDATDTAQTQNITIAVDSNGNPTTLPHDGAGGDFGGMDSGGDCSMPTGGTGSNSSTGTTTNSSSGSVSVNSSTGSVTNASLVADTSNGTYQLSAKVLGNAVNSLGFVGGYYVLFAPTTVDAAVKSDLTQISSDQSALGSVTKALSAADKNTLKADQKAIAAAIKAIAATLTPLEKALKSDSSSWSKTIAADNRAIKADKNDTSALTTAKAKLASDRASAFAAIAADQADILTAINGNSGVVAAQAKLATDLPSISVAEAKLQADQSQLVSDIEAE